MTQYYATTMRLINIIYSIDITGVLKVSHTGTHQVSTLYLTDAG